MTNKRPTELHEVPLNDVDAAVEYIRRKKQAGTLRSEDIEVCLMAQHDPSELLERLVALDAEFAARS
jgi:hypothetical protein